MELGACLEEGRGGLRDFKPPQLGTAGRPFHTAPIANIVIP